MLKRLAFHGKAQNVSSIGIGRSIKGDNHGRNDSVIVVNQKLELRRVSEL